MSYPMKAVTSPFGGTDYVEMNHQEYEDRLAWFRDHLESLQNEEDLSKSMEGYVAYLRQWFSDGQCDGLLDYQMRYNLHTLPMSSNIYLFH